MNTRAHKDSADMIPTAQAINDDIDSIVFYVGEGITFLRAVQMVSKDSVFMQGIFRDTVLSAAQRILKKE